MKEIQHHLGCVKPENDEQDFFHQSTVSWSTIVSPKPIRSWNCWWKDFQTNKLMTRKISQFLAIRFMVSYLSTVSPDFYTINNQLFYSWLFSFLQAYIYILMIWSTWSKVARKTPSVHSWKTSRSSVFFKSLLVECVDGLSLPNNNCKHGAAQNSTRCWVDVWQPQPRTFGNREA